MAELEIQGIGTIEVGDEFKKLSPEQQNAFVNQVINQIRTRSQPEQEKPQISRAEAAGRAILSGATYGFADELSGALAAGYAKAFGGKVTKDIPLSELYQQARDTQREKLSQAREKYPIQSIATEILGSLPLGSKVLQTTGLEGSLAKNVGGGALLGTIAGAGEAENESKIIPSAIEGGAIGGVLGGVIHGAGAAGKTLFTAGKRALSINPSAEQILAKRLTPEEASKSAKTLIQAEKEGSRMGILETENRKLGTLAKEIIKQPTKGGELLTENIAKKAGETTEATKNILKGIGDVGNYFKNLDDVIFERQKISSPLFEQAKKEGASIPENEKLSILLGDERIQNALKIARKDFGIKSSDNSLEALHGARQAIDDIIQPAIKAGENNKAKAYSKLRGEISDLLYEVSPTMKEADKIYSGFSSIKNAYEEGINFKSEKTPEEFSRTLAKFKDNPSELEGFKNGVVQSLLQDVLAVSAETPNPAKKVMGSELNREKLRLLFDKPADYNKVIKHLEDEVAIVNTKSKVLGRSSFPLSPQDEVKFSEYAIMNPMSGSFHLKVVDALGNSLAKRYHGLDEKNTKALAEIFTSREKSIDALLNLAKKADPSQQQIILQAVRDYLPTVTAAQLAAGEVRPLKK